MELYIGLCAECRAYLRFSLFLSAPPLLLCTLSLCLSLSHTHTHTQIRFQAYSFEFHFLISPTCEGDLYLYNVLSDHMYDCTIFDNDNTYNSNHSQIMDFVSGKYHALFQFVPLNLLQKHCKVGIMLSVLQ